MTEWTIHTPRFDGDAPEGVGLDTHEVEWSYQLGDRYEKPIAGRYAPWRKAPSPLLWEKGNRFRYYPHGHPVPPKPVDYEAWGPVISAFSDAFHLSPDESTQKSRVNGLIAAMRVAINIPACMEDVKG